MIYPLAALSGRNMQDLIDAAENCGDSMLGEYFSKLDPRDINKLMGETRLVDWLPFARETPLSYVHGRSKCHISDNKEEYAALFELIVQKGGEVGCPTVLRSAIESGDLLTVLRSAIENGDLLLFQRVLRFAIENGDLLLFQRVLDNWETEGRVLHRAMTTLVGCARSPEHLEMARVLLDKGVDPNAGFLDEARYPELIRLLLEHSSDPAALLNSADPRSGKTLLYRTLKNFRYMSQKAESNAQCMWSSEEEEDFEDRSEYHKKAREQMADHVRYLVRMGADPLIRTTKGKTCRDLGHEVCELLDSI